MFKGNKYSLMNGSEHRSGTPSRWANSQPKASQYNLHSTSEVDFYNYANVNSDLEVPQAIYKSESRDSHENMDHLKEYDSHSTYSHSPSTMDDDKVYKRSSLAFLAISIVSAILVLVFELYMYAVINVHKKDMDRPAKYTEISIYLSFFIFAAIYQMILTVIGLRSKNMLLLVMLCGFYCCMLIYTGIQYKEISKTVGRVLSSGWKRATQGMNIATIVVIAVTLVLQVYMIFVVLCKNVKWFRYKKIGADLAIKKMYNIFQIHRSLLIFDLFFFLGFTVQFIVIMIKDKKSVEFILTVCVLPLTLVILFLSDIAATRESKILTGISIIAYLGGCVYVLFKTVRLFTKYTSAFHMAIDPGDYFPGRSSLVTFGVITLVLLLATIGFEIVLLRNYDRGLLPIVSRSYSWLPGHNANTRKEHLETIETRPGTEYYGQQNIDAVSSGNGSLLID